MMIGLTCSADFVLVPEIDVDVDAVEVNTFVDNMLSGKRDRVEAETIGIGVCPELGVEGNELSLGGRIVTVLCAVVGPTLGVADVTIGEATPFARAVAESVVRIGHRE